MLRQLPELAESLGKEQKARRGLNSPIHLSDRLISGHDDQGISADCKLSPYRRQEKESCLHAGVMLEDTLTYSALPKRCCMNKTCTSEQKESYT